MDNLKVEWSKFEDNSKKLLLEMFLFSKGGYRLKHFTCVLAFRNLCKCQLRKGVESLQMPLWFETQVILKLIS